MFTSVQGKLGSGKSLYAAAKIDEYLSQGRRVACNYPLNVDLLKDRYYKDVNITILPTFVNSQMLLDLGLGGTREENAGLLVIDECLLLFNSRSWNDKDRSNVVEFFVNARKLKWDVLLIIQDTRAFDKQIRETFIETVTNCIRLDKMKMPFLPIKMPQIHLGITRYGTLPTAPVCDRKFYRPSKFLISLYDSYTIFKKGDTFEDPKSYFFKSKISLLTKFREDLNSNPIYYLTYFAHRPVYILFNFLYKRSLLC